MPEGPESPESVPQSFPPAPQGPGPQGPGPETPAPQGPGPQARGLQGSTGGPPAGTRVPALRQMDVGELIDASIKLYRDHWRTLVGMFGIVMVPLLLIEQPVFDSVVSRGTLHPRQTQGEFVFGPMVGLASALGLIRLVLLSFLVGAVSWATAGLYLGSEPRIGAAYRFALSLFGRLLWVILLTGLVVIGGLLLFLIPGIYIAIRLVFAAPAVVVEGARGGGALKRSLSLAEGHWWRIFGTLILTLILTFIASFIVAFPFELLAPFAGPLAWLVRAIGTAAADVITTPFSIIVVVLLYFDMRIRKEGFDLSLTAQELGA